MSIEVRSFFSSFLQLSIISSVHFFLMTLRSPNSRICSSSSVKSSSSSDYYSPSSLPNIIFSNYFSMASSSNPYIKSPKSISAPPIKASSRASSMDCSFLPPPILPKLDNRSFLLIFFVLPLALLFLFYPFFLEVLVISWNMASKVLNWIKNWVLPELPRENLRMPQNHSWILRMPCRPNRDLLYRTYHSFLFFLGHWGLF